MMRRLSDKVTVSGQILPEDTAALARAGVRMLVNNRPDREEVGQPSSDEIRRAAEAAGIDYVHAPFQGRPGPAEAEVMAQALDAADGGVHAFCRSGMRSTSAWALMAVSRGEPVDQVIASARDAGYDVAPLFF